MNENRDKVIPLLRPHPYSIGLNGEYVVMYWDPIPGARSYSVTCLDSQGNITSIDRIFRNYYLTREGLIIGVQAMVDP